MTLDRIHQIAEAELLGHLHERGEEERRADIRVLCKLAGCPDRADLFIADGLSIGEAGARLQCGNFEPKKPTAESHDEVFRAEYLNTPYFAKQGISEANYIRSRRIDEGLDSFGMIPNKTLNEIRNS